MRGEDWWDSEIDVLVTEREKWCRKQESEEIPWCLRSGDRGSLEKITQSKGEDGREDTGLEQEENGKHGKRE